MLVNTTAPEYTTSHGHSAWFSCFSYDILDEHDDAVNIHFANAEFQALGPLHEEKLQSRRAELHDALFDIRTRFHQVQDIRGKSWLYNLPVYRQFFPKSYLEGLSLDSDEDLWGRGSTIWGQFIDSQMRLKEHKAKEFLEEVEKLEVGKPLSDLFKVDSVVLPPLTTSGPIKDFYEMYDV